MTDTFLKRRSEVLRLAAEQGLSMQLRESGFWLHEDLRDNVYLALHGMVYLYESHPENYREREDFQRFATVLQNALQLQDADPNSDTYGHWPIFLPEDPQEAKPSPLPVELMGCLLIHFQEMYSVLLPESLKQLLQLAIGHIYASRVYNGVIIRGVHHEAKWTCLTLMLGFVFEDEALLAKGRADLLILLEMHRKNGMLEYGALPWFWHWIQVMTCAWEAIDNTEVRGELQVMLDFLWSERELFYLKGAWAGPHSRVLAHDVPEDRNVLHDYIQFGDFTLPQHITRLEGAALFHHPAPASIREAVYLCAPMELKKEITIPQGLTGTKEDTKLHVYLYRTPDYAVGGMWERTEEYANEQHRWDITLPRRNGGNQAFFYHPGEGYQPRDARHASSSCDVIYGKNAIASVFRIPETCKAEIVGWLPKGEWICEDTSAYGLVDGVYLLVHLSHPFIMQETPEGICVASMGRLHAVAMEALASAEATKLGIHDLDSFVATGTKNKFKLTLRDSSWTNTGYRLEYHSISGMELMMEARDTGDAGSLVQQTVNQAAIDFSDYHMTP